MYKKTILTVLIILTLVLPALAQQMPPPPDLGDGQIVAGGLNGPQGVFVDAEGYIYVIDSGMGGEERVTFFNTQTYEPIPGRFGHTTVVMRLNPDGEPEVVAQLPSIATGSGPEDGEFLGGARLTEIDGTLYTTVGGWHSSLGNDVTIENYSAVVSLAGDAPELVADLWAHEATNNPDETSNLESHPCGITAGADGMLYIADAAANALLRVDPNSGEVETVTGFEGIPGVFPSQTRGGELLADPVPTGVVVNEDGSAFVSFLSGAPFVPGSAKVVQVSPDGEVSDYATGLTMLTDLQRGPDGNLYAVSFGMFTQEGPVFNSGAIIRILEDGNSEIVVDGLPFATGLAIDTDGNGYVAINGIAIPQAGMVVRYEALTVMAGMPTMEAGS